MGTTPIDVTTSKVVNELKSIRLSTAMVKAHIRTRYKHIIADKIFGYISQKVQSQKTLEYDDYIKVLYNILSTFHKNIDKRSRYARFLESIANNDQRVLFKL